MKLLITVALFGMVAIKTASPEAVVSKAIDSASKGLDAVGQAGKDVGDNVQANGRDAVDAIGSAGASAVADPMGAVQGLSSQAMNALPLDMSKMTGMMLPMANMAQKMAVNALDAGEVMLTGGAKHMNEGMTQMQENMKSIPLVGGLMGPLFGMFGQVSRMQQPMTASIFNIGRRGLSMPFELMGAPAVGPKNGIKPEYSDGAYQIPGLSSLTGLIPKMPTLGAPAAPAAAAAAAA